MTLLLASCNIYGNETIASNDYYTDTTYINNSNKNNNLLDHVVIESSKEAYETKETIVLNLSYYDSTGKSDNLYYNGEKIDNSFLEWFYSFNGGNAVLIQKCKSISSVSLVFNEKGTYIFWAKYCIHDSHNDTKGDIVSNKLIINVELCAEDKVMFNYVVKTDGTIRISAGPMSKYESDIAIPNEIDGYKVSEIIDSGFINCTNLQSVKINYGLEKIGEEAFKNCSSLKYVVIPSSVNSIGKYAFSGCSSELYGFFETSDVTKISGYNKDGFYNSYSSFHYGFSHYATSCKDYLITEEGFEFAVNNDSTLGIISYSGSKRDIEIPSFVNNMIVTSIFGYSFENKGITSIKIPNTIEFIGKYAFNGCSSLKNIEIPSSCKEIRTGTFQGCTGFTSIKINYGLEKIGEEAFKNCSSLKYVVIPSSVNSIGKYAFSGCSSELYGFFETSDVTKISGYNKDGFYNSYSSFHYGFSHIYTGVYDYAISNDLIYAKSSASTWLVIGYEMPNLNVVVDDNIDGVEVVKISSKAFYENNRVETIILGKYIKNIGENAFYNCTGLKWIVISSSITSIEKNAFTNCTNVSIFIDKDEKSISLDKTWNSSNRPVYYKNEWKYVDGIPTII